MVIFHLTGEILPERNKIKEKSRKKCKNNRKGDILFVKSDIVGWKYHLFLCKITILSSEKADWNTRDKMGGQRYGNHCRCDLKATEVRT